MSTEIVHLQPALPGRSVYCLPGSAVYFSTQGTAVGNRTMTFKMTRLRGYIYRYMHNTQINFCTYFNLKNNNLYLMEYLLLVVVVEVVVLVVVVVVIRLCILSY